jgi:hypothetical protein
MVPDIPRVKDILNLWTSINVFLETLLKSYFHVEQLD